LVISQVMKAGEPDGPSPDVVKSVPSRGTGEWWCRVVLFGWLFYVRLPKMPTEVDVADDGWINFRGRRGTEKVHVATIKSIGRGLGGKTVRVRHGGGRLRMANGVKDFYDFLATVKGMNPAIDIRGF